MSEVDTAVLVVNYGSHELVEENLKRTIRTEGIAVVVVDNFTDLAERTAVRDVCARHDWHLIEAETNLGFGGGMNRAAAVAEGLGARSLILLNPDAYLEEGGLERLRSLAAADPTALVSPLVVRVDGRHFASLMEVDLDSGAVRRVVPERRFAHRALWLSGACLATSVELFRTVGGFDDDYFLYWEDIDLSVRVVEAGGRLLVDDSIRAVHSAGGTQRAESGDRAKSATYYFYNTRNRLVFAAKHVPRGRQLRWLIGSVRAGYSILLRGGRRQFARPSRSIRPAVAGTLAGVRFLWAHHRPSGGDR